MLSAIVQNGVSGISIFCLYRFLLKALGMEMLGLYSVVLSITTVLGMFNTGFSGSLVRFVSIFSAKEQPEKVAALIRTIFTSLLVFFSVLVFLLLASGNWLVGFLNLGIQDRAAFENLLPLASLVFLSGILGGVFMSSLEGIQRAYLKNYLLSAASVSNLALAVFLIPAFGLRGLFLAYLASNGITYLLSWLLLRQHLRYGIGLFPIGWNKDVFRQTFSYNATFQVISLSSLFYDPLIRMLLVRFGGLPLAGLYELSSKLILQVRGILVALNQSLVPVFAGLEKEEFAENRLKLFLKSHHMIFILSNFALALLAMALPLISLIWMSSLNVTFLQVALLLIPGWMANAVSVPVYFASIGFGELKSLLYHHLALAILVPAFCGIAGILGFKLGLVAAWSLGLVLCSLPLIPDFFFRHKIPASQILPAGSLWIFLAHAFAAAGWVTVWKSSFTFALPSAVIFSASAIFIYIFAYWRAGFLTEIKRAIRS